MKCFAARQGSADSQVQHDKDSLHGAEKKALLLGQLYVGLNSLWEPVVTVIVQLMYCLVLCCCLAGIHPPQKTQALPHQDLHAKMAIVYGHCRSLIEHKSDLTGSLHRSLIGNQYVIYEATLNGPQPITTAGLWKRTLSERKRQSERPNSRENLSPSSRWCLSFFRPPSQEFLYGGQ